jgi:hypothetical protein
MFGGIQGRTWAGFVCLAAVFGHQTPLLDGSWLMLTDRPLSCMMSRHTPFMSGYPRLHQIALSMVVRRSFWLRHGELGFFPKRFIQLGDIGIVDFLVAHFAPAERIVKPV